MSHVIRHLSSESWSGLHAAGTHLSHLASEVWSRVFSR
jgi:hypothetical protein